LTGKFGAAFEGVADRRRPAWGLDNGSTRIVVFIV
jgi:hypothetical protein